MIYLIIALLLIGGLVYISLQYFANKKEKSIFGLLFTSGMSLVMLAEPTWFDKMLAFIGVLNNKQFDAKFNFWYFGLGSVLIICSVLVYRYSKNKMYILNVNGYQDKKVETIFKTKQMLKYDCREREINFVRMYERLFAENKNQEVTSCICEEIKIKVETLKSESNEFKVGYTGIAPIPFIMLTGTHLNRIEISKYYEWDKNSSKYYNLKDKIKRFPELKKISSGDVGEGDKEVVIAISTTKEITDNDLIQFKNRFKIIKYKLDDCKDNAILSKSQLDSYVDVIIREIQRLNNVDVIHIICSAQSCLALELGKRFEDTTRIQKVISYQFEMQSNPKYPWGIVINGQDKGKIVEESIENV